MVFVFPDSWLNTADPIYCKSTVFNISLLYFKFKAYEVYIIYLFIVLLVAPGHSWKLITNEINKDYCEVLTFPDDSSTPMR